MWHSAGQRRCVVACCRSRGVPDRSIGPGLRPWVGGCRVAAIRDGHLHIPDDGAYGVFSNDHMWTHRYDLCKT